MPKLTMTLVLASVLLASVASTPVPAAEAVMKTRLKPFNVAIRVFDPAKGVGRKGFPTDKQVVAFP